MGADSVRVQADRRCDNVAHSITNHFFDKTMPCGNGIQSTTNHAGSHFLICKLRNISHSPRRLVGERCAAVVEQAPNSVNFYFFRSFHQVPSPTTGVSTLSTFPRVQRFVGEDAVSEKGPIPECDIVVATVGRFGSLLHRGYWKNCFVDFLVLDEADLLLSGQLLPKTQHVVQKILALCEKQASGSSSAGSKTPNEGDEGRCERCLVPMAFSATLGPVQCQAFEKLFLRPEEEENSREMAVEYDFVDVEFERVFVTPQVRVQKPLHQGPQHGDLITGHPAFLKRGAQQEREGVDLPAVVADGGAEVVEHVVQPPAADANGVRHVVLNLGPVSEEDVQGKTASGLRADQDRLAVLQKLLPAMPFKQALVFADYGRTKLAEELNSKEPDVAEELNVPIKAVVADACKNKNPSGASERECGAGEEAGGSSEAPQDHASESRGRSLDLLRTGQANVGIASDLFTRGVVFPDVDLVVNFHQPYDKEAYLHR